MGVSNMAKQNSAETNKDKQRHKQTARDKQRQAANGPQNYPDITGCPKDSDRHLETFRFRDRRMDR